MFSDSKGERKLSKRIVSGIVATLLLMGILALTFSVRTATSSPATTVSVKPPSIIDLSLVPDTLFKVNCSVAEVTDLFTWQIKLFFNPTVLNCTGASYPTDHVFAGKTIVPVAPIIDNDAGSVLFGCSLMGAGAAFAGSGTMCQVEFKVKSIGESGLEYSKPYGEDTYLLNSNLDSIVAETEDGYFSNVPAPQIQYTLSIASTDGGTTDPASGTYTYPEGTQVGVLAIPDLSFFFDHWELDGLNYTTTRITVTMDKNHTLLAVFTTVPPPPLLGDINGDSIVDMKDILVAAKAFGSRPGHPAWNPDADVFLNRRIDLFDIALIAHNFGKTL